MIYLVTYYEEYDNPDGEYSLGQFTRYFTDKAEAETYMNEINELCNYYNGCVCYKVVEIAKG